MSQIHSRDTKPEMCVRRALHAAGYRFRVGNKDLPGSPDISIKKYGLAIFVNGCFWHGHENCEMYHLPKSNVEFWQKKIDRNRARDIRVLDLYKQHGWTALVVCECQLKRKTDAELTIARLLNTLHYLTNRGEVVKIGDVSSADFEDDFDSTVSFGYDDWEAEGNGYRIAAEPEEKFGGEDSIQYAHLCKTDSEGFEMIANNEKLEFEKRLGL